MTHAWGQDRQAQWVLPGESLSLLRDSGQHRTREDGESEQDPDEAEPRVDRKPSLEAEPHVDRKPPLVDRPW
ncbi:hypothetical protein B1H18_09275 [Streptomyces tsukubensis]|uniref:Uncharacterized protein n=1 Tax=Streptomyces tsukubensis TaxID=83656 RepID=A0A1V4AC23_9ACTN|nr:hypothetical protein B1H18_09275 [Streptomyces tsukubensis]